ncbi:MAG: Stk1 family PASTA domain-containing Ser/Thr kinase [Actinomycetia bacterium]|nr:Stk1 family PASTA domain-containing Ser/Thr kinase [Actinomycetes bacterium]
MSEQDLRVLGDRYEIHRRLARGGMAQVYLARDRSLDRPVAIKELVSEFATDPSFVERFRREAQAAANLAHPNIVGVYDWGTQDGTYFIVMEYVDGPSLSQVIRRDGPLHPRRAAELASEVAAALGFAHSRGVVHRDVKPGNVLLTGSGQSKVTDFGIARALSSSDEDLTQAGSVMGTATYFSPEQAQGLPVDPRSDLYSLGVVLYEMVSGRTPFTGDTPLAIAYKHVQDQPEPPSTVITDMPAGMDAVVMKLLSKKPEDRYASAEELRADLRRFLEGEETNAEAALAAAGLAAGAVAGAAVAGAAADPGATAVQPAATGAAAAGAAMVADEPDGGGKSRTGLFLGAMVVLLALVAGGLFWWASGLSSDVEVPQVVGSRLEDAQAQLEDLGLEVEVVEEANDQVDPGRVSEQDPEAGQTLQKGDTVQLTVSTGTAMVEVPNVIGMTLEDARAALESRGFTVASDSAESEDAEPGTVILQDPGPATEAEEGSQVGVVVSKGPGEEIVPDVSGQSFSAAQAELEAAGFRVAGPEEQASDSVPSGQVIGTDPATGTSAERNTRITVIVSSGKEQVTVPNVVNQSESNATATLQGKGFDVAVSTTVVPSGDPSVGRVVSQSPSGQSRADKGSTVTITVGVASTTTSTSSTSSSTTTSTTSP